MAEVMIKGQALELDADSLSVGEAVELEDKYGETFGRWAKAAQDGSIKAVRVLLLVLARRQDKSLRMDDIDSLGLEVLGALAKSKSAAPSPVTSDGGAEVPVEDPTQTA